MVYNSKTFSSMLANKKRLESELIELNAKLKDLPSCKVAHFTSDGHLMMAVTRLAQDQLCDLYDMLQKWFDHQDDVASERLAAANIEREICAAMADQKGYFDLAQAIRDRNLTNITNNRVITNNVDEKD